MSSQKRKNTTKSEITKKLRATIDTKKGECSSNEIDSNDTNITFSILNTSHETLNENQETLKKPENAASTSIPSNKHQQTSCNKDQTSRYRNDENNVSMGLLLT